MTNIKEVIVRLGQHMLMRSTLPHSRRLLAAALILPSWLQLAAPALGGEGATLWCGPQAPSLQQQQALADLLRAAGKDVPDPENGPENAVMTCLCTRQQGLLKRKKGG